MSPIIKFLSAFVFLSVLVSGCSGESDDAATQGKKEQLPKVNTSDFRKIKRNKVTLLLYKKMSLNRVQKGEVINADFLPEEYHLSVRKVSKSFFRKDPDYPSKNQLKWFAGWAQQKLRQKLISFEAGALEKVRVENKLCYKLEVAGRTFGFPLDKQFFLRFYELKDGFLVVEGWTVKKNAATFRPIIQYMGMTLTTED